MTIFKVRETNSLHVSYKVDCIQVKSTSFQYSKNVIIEEKGYFKEQQRGEIKVNVYYFFRNPREKYNTCIKNLL